MVGRKAFCDVLQTRHTFQLIGIYTFNLPLIQFNKHPSDDEGFSIDVILFFIQEME